MGAAEYEFGAIPDTLGGLARDHRQLTVYTIWIPNDQVKKTVLPQPSAAKKTKKTKKPTEDAQRPGTDSAERAVYVLGRKTQMADIERTVRAMAAGTHQTKNGHRMPNALNPRDDFDARTIGWLEVNNGWFAFVDRAACLATAKVFCVEEW